MHSKAAIIKCENYGLDNVREAVNRGIHLLGGLSCFAAPGETILLKPNLLSGDPPEKSVTTHPVVFQAAAEAFKAGGARVLYGDSPAVSKPERAFKQAGYKDIADALDVRLTDFRTAVKVSFPDALLAKQLHLAKGALDADGIVSICKMKTHGFTRITGAVKNQFGCIPGLLKSEFHVKMPDVYDFSRVLVDINSFLKPRLYIMDGIIAMEGNGPRGGEPTAMKVLLFSSDPVALDAVFCRLINLNPEFVPTMKLGREAGLGTYLPGEIKLVGDDFEACANPHFKAVRLMPDRMVSARSFPPFLKPFVSPKPVIDKKRCVNCGTCVLQCPVTPRAVDWPKGKKNRPPVYDYTNCIRCYCCQEICPEKAITIKTPLPGRILRRVAF